MGEILEDRNMNAPLFRNLIETRERRTLAREQDTTQGGGGFPHGQ
ncbi:MAG TPA: hypothetical protein VGZ91_07035 [Candidatus Sulfotelmatobacter sp.]|jgi:hypothetical protein|nr:hypothetical protein [Candidatus Sulfotelmatobacter sp.]